MSTKLGVHVATGSRNGYGNVAAAGPVVVLAVNEGGALLEAWDKSGMETVTIFRDQTVFHDAPPNIDQMTEAQARAAADFYWPALREKYRLNPADYYQATNEYGGDNEVALRNLVAFETRLMELAELDGLNLAIGSPAGGSPGSWDLWVEYYVPLIRRAAEGQHIYSRHAYGGVVDGSSGLLTLPTGQAADRNAERPFVEAAYLREHGILVPMVITEAGQNAGYQFPGVEAFMADAARYDTLCREHPNIWGFCAWTYGDYQGFSANIESASAALAAYCAEQGPTVFPGYPHPAIIEEPPMSERGKPRTQYARTYVVIGEAATEEQAVETFKKHWRLARRTVGGSYDDAGIGDLAERHAILTHIKKEDELLFRNWYEMNYPGLSSVTFEDSLVPAPAVFRFEAWPTSERRVTQRFGANPDYYRQFGLPGHEGVDLAAAHGTPIYAVAAGTVYLATGNAGNYGIQVRIDHGNGWKTVYAHNAELLVRVGDIVQAGQQIARADNTGNSNGSHLHLTLKRDGQPTPGWPADIVDPTPYITPFNPTWPGGTQPTPGTVDLLPYFLPLAGGNGPLYELRFPDGSQQRCQVQSAGAWFYVTKGTGGRDGKSEWEQLRADSQYIYRGLDTSPGNGLYYWQTDPGSDAAKWCPRHMYVGQTWTGSPHNVQFYNKSNCQPVSVPWNGQAVNRVTFLARHAAWQSPTGLVFNDVIEIGDPAGEVFGLKAGIGMIYWRAPWNQSAISELHPAGARPDNIREPLC